MKTRTCPLCSHQFKRGKRNSMGVSCCPNDDCGVELYYDGEETILMSLHRMKVDTAKKILEVFYKYSSIEPPRDFDPRLYAAELNAANKIIEKAQLFLSKVSGPDVCPYEFAIEVTEETARNWRSDLVTPIQILGYMTTPANTVWRGKKQAWEKRKAWEAVSMSSRDGVDVSQLGKPSVDVRQVVWGD